MKVMKFFESKRGRRSDHLFFTLSNAMGDDLPISRGGDDEDVAFTICHAFHHCHDA